MDFVVASHTLFMVVQSSQIVRNFCDNWPALDV